MYDDEPEWKVYINCMKAMYKKNPIRIDVAGSVESIQKIDKDILYTCYNNFYVPENMVLVMTGNFNPEEMIEKVMSGSASQDNEDRFSTGIAVRNVIDRLQLYYKQKEFFTIESDGPDTGTTVHIMIPVEKDDTEIPKDGE